LLLAVVEELVVMDKEAVAVVPVVVDQVIHKLVVMVEMVEYHQEKQITVQKFRVLAVVVAALVQVIQQEMVVLVVVVDALLDGIQYSTQTHQVHQDQYITMNRVNIGILILLVVVHSQFKRK
jgi:hypothetical protein